MRVIGVDPGYDRLGVAILEYDADGKEVVIFSTCIETDKKSSLNERLFTAGSSFTKVLKTYKPDALAIETLFFNQNQKTAIGVAAARGIVIFLAQQYNCLLFEYGPQEVKVALTGYGKSDKQGVMDMVARLVRNVPEKALDDEYDAIAVATTCLAVNGRV